MVSSQDEKSKRDSMWHETFKREQKSELTRKNNGRRRFEEENRIDQNEKMVSINKHRISNMATRLIKTKQAPSGVHNQQIH